MDKPTQTRNRKSKARERIRKRAERREAVSDMIQDTVGNVPDVPVSKLASNVTPALNVVRDWWWHFKKDMPLKLILQGVGGFLLVFVGIFFLTTVFSRDIGPNLSSMGIKLSGMTVDEATETLFAYWNEEMTIDIMLDDTIFETVSPADIGISLDATATAQAAKDAGLSGFPFGQEIDPVLSVDYGDVQAYMLAIGNAVYIPSYEAGYEWRDGQLVSVMGTSSRELDVLISIQRVTDNALQIVTDGMVSLATTSTPPAVVEADPYFNDALSFVTSDFILEGYDPFTNDSQRWATTRQEMADWLVVTDAGLTIREDGLEDFVNTVNQNIDLNDWSRYLDPVETYDAISTAFLTNEDTANVRIRYADSTYELQDGDWGLRLGRRLGLPLFNIQTANPGLDWDDVYAGQNVSLPSRDLVVPLDPVINKRIVVDLDRRYLVAYENDEVVHHWPISIGRTDAQTHPGVFQILSKVDIAFGSSFSLCNADNECGQWEMDHFMGIYQVGVGLTNGFHGTVRLPNGGTLTRGSTQSATTFGCVMSDEAQAQILYEWAETGVVVELIDAVYPPQSDLGRDAMTFIDDLYQS